MNAEILCIGTELVLGDILNTNAQYLSQQLAQKGIDVFYQSSIGDNPERIIKSLSVSVTRSNLIIFTGGLGPTADDITISTVANALNIPLEKNQDALNKMKEYFEKTGREFTVNNEKQALLPKGCIVLPNDIGTAPGCIIESGNQRIVFLPGPPSELKLMYENYLSKYLEQYSDSIIKSKFVRIYGVAESMIDTMANSLINGTNPTVAPYAADGETKLRVTAKAKDEQTANKMIDETVKQIEDIFGANVYGYDDDTLESVIVNLLKEKGLTVATAESCTAGYISKRITDISGASTVFNMGVSTYSNESKTNELGVPAELIAEHGAVSSQVAASMAKGVKLKSNSDIGLSITGIAGPKSDDSQKPVGLSYIGISTKDGEFVIKSMKGENKDREYIRFTSASEALNLLRLYLENGKRGLKAERVDAKLVTETKKEPVSFEPIEIETKSKFETEAIVEKNDNAVKKRKLSIGRPLPLDPSEFTVVSVGESEDEGFVSETVSFEQFEKAKPKKQ
ncbi:MAG: competence/damage-inducible protein A, partial [Clostridia bacterium]|nr:competence/damage-inducible protein A [Clostridia bacterium]